MSFADAVWLFGIMVVLAATPSASVALVVSRAAVYGVRSGAAVAAGIVAGDLVFVTLALLGMSSLAQALGPFFVAIKFLGGGYLIFTGAKVLRAGLCRKSAGAETDHPAASAGRHHTTSFVAGFLLTLGDLKAIFFYASLFPTLADMSALTATDVVLIIGVTVVTVGGVKLVYATAARRLAQLTTRPAVERGLTLATGGVMVGAGTYLIAKT